MISKEKYCAAWGVIGLFILGFFGFIISVGGAALLALAFGYGLALGAFVWGVDVITVYLDQK